MATIKQIDRSTVHQIQSGQVIVDLCSVVKELVENSIDAGATIIDVRFKNQGLEQIEVQDNGTGIAPSNYASVALKHHTSKLSSYTDLASLQTFGFRGEALASLCALSILSVTTCQASEVPRGTKLTFEPSGKLKGSDVVAAQRGTSVSVDQLFHSLPVRRRELERNIKREWQKVIALLNQYACIQTNLRFTASQQPTKGKRIHLFSTNSNPSTRENIMNVFGAKTITALVPLELRLEMEPSVARQAVQLSAGNQGASKKVLIVGHVSRPAHGEGRQTPDRQMFYVNGRPCNLPQFAKTFNEVYKAYNSSQSPFILADVQLDTHMYDVNVSPDKRSILLHDQNKLLDTLRTSLLALFDAQDYEVPAAQLVRSTHGAKNGSLSEDNAVVRPGKSVASVQSSNIDTEAESRSREADLNEKVRHTKALRGSVRAVGTSKSLSKDKAGQNLISGWVERAALQESNSPEPLSESSDSDSVENEGLPARDESVTANRNLNRREAISHPVADFNQKLRQYSLTSINPTPRTSHISSQPPVPSRIINSSRLVSEKLQLADQISDSGSDEDSNQEYPPSASNSLAMGRVARSTSVRHHSHLELKLAESSAVINGSTSNRIEAFSGSIAGHQAQESHDDLDPPNRNSGNLSSNENDDHDVGSSAENQLRRRVVTEAPISVTSSPEADRTPSLSSPSQNHRSGRSLANMPERLADQQLAESSQSIGTALTSIRTANRKKEKTLQMMQTYRCNESSLLTQTSRWANCIRSHDVAEPSSLVPDLDAPDAEERLSLTISKADFFGMRIAGQFNLGFILAVRSRNGTSEQTSSRTKHDDLFIIDQHATDEKYNFERLQANTVVQSQRLVHPKQLELTALEEEIVMENLNALETNGFKVQADTSGSKPVGSRCQLTALPLSRETTFSLSDLEELISLLGEGSSDSKQIPRPSRTRKMFAMRACRSSIMIGKPLTYSQMQSLARHMGELDKPWNCPHGRPTMRHLCTLETWNERSWHRDYRGGHASNWSSYMRDD